MIHHDKIDHLVLGYIIGDIFEPIGIYSILIVLGFGIGKELFDKYIKKTKFDVADLVCTFAGGFGAYWLNLVYGGLM